jgi:hypothetical protein
MKNCDCFHLSPLTVWLRSNGYARKDFCDNLRQIVVSGRPIAAFFIQWVGNCLTSEFRFWTTSRAREHSLRSMLSIVSGAWMNFALLSLRQDSYECPMGVESMKSVKSAHSCTIKIPRTIPATTPAEKISSISFICYAFRKLFFFSLLMNLLRQEGKTNTTTKSLKSKYLGRVAGWQLAHRSCQIVNDWKKKCR